MHGLNVFLDKVDIFYFKLRNIDDIARKHKGYKWKSVHGKIEVKLENSYARKSTPCLLDFWEVAPESGTYQFMSLAMLIPEIYFR